MAYHSMRSPMKILFLEQEFDALAAAWTRLGASAVRLLENGQTLASVPLEAPEQPAGLIACDASSGLELHVHGLADAALQESANWQVNILGRALQSEQDMEMLTASLVEMQDRLAALYDLTRATRGAIQVNDLLDLLTAESRRLLDAAGAFAVAYLPGQPPIIRQHGQQPLPKECILAATTLYRREPGRRAFKESEIHPLGLNNLIIAALPVREQVFACLGVFNKNSDFTAPDAKLLKAITDQAGARFENALLYQEAILRARLDAEMHLARQVQMALMPQIMPRLNGVDIYGVSAPASQVGGDFFDVTSSSAHPLVFLLGDVTGKGIPAALLMTMTRTVAHSAVRYMPFKTPQQVMERLNKDLLDDYSTAGMFTTAFVGVLEQSPCRLFYTNAGQSPVLYLSAGGEPVLIEATDTPVGIFDNHLYTSHELKLSPGDVFVAMTNGFNEARNEAGELFGVERLKEALLKFSFLNAREIADGLLKTVSDYAGGRPQDDDRTLIVLKITCGMAREMACGMTREMACGMACEMATEIIQSDLNIFANYEHLRLPAQVLRRLCNQAGVPEETIEQCELALQKLLINLVKHAYHDNSVGQIGVHLQVNSAEILIQTQDNGEAAFLDLDTILAPDPLALQERGYDMAIIKNLMDEFSHRRDNEQNTWTLRKHFNRE